MTNKILLKNEDLTSHLTSLEKKQIQEKVEYEIVKSHHKMINVGSITNIISGIFIIWILYGQEKTSLLLGWYAALIFASVTDMAWAYRYKSPNLTELKTWRRGFYIIFALLCLVWGSMGVLFLEADPNYQLYIIAFLLAVLIGFSFSSITDFTIAVICITCLLVPTIVWRSYLGISHIMTSGHDPELNFGISISLLILGTFLLVVCYFGASLVKKFFTISFENVSLSEKLGNMNKILEQRVKERTIELENSLKLVTYQATHDLLTDLPNQRLLKEYMQSAMNRVDENNHLLGVVFFTINEIEKINDGLGHQTGDVVIRKIARRLKNSFATDETQINGNVRYTITLSRKDVFIILIESIKTIEQLEKASEKLFGVLDEPVRIKNQIIKLTASIGISIYPNNGRDIKSLLMNADAAMLKAKQRGGNSINFYKSEINADISRQIEMESLLHDALKNNEFILQYQPFVDLKTGQICGAETLVRWKSPKLGFISPADFIPLCEANGLIVPLGEWVIKKSCSLMKTWHELHNSFKLAINLSAKQLHQKNIIEVVIKILNECKVKPEFIELELTETAAFQEEVIPIIKKFNQIGIGLSIDDFGTGFSGLSNLKLFEIDKLKIDKSFITDMFTSSDNRAIVLNIIDLAKKLDITVLAEGVETEEQMRFLQEHGCDLMQGYYFSPPVDPDTFTEFLKTKKCINMPHKIMS